VPKVKRDNLRPVTAKSSEFLGFLILEDYNAIQEAPPTETHE
jgi:hypothetical protein